MRKMKDFCILFLCIVLVFSLTGCQVMDYLDRKVTGYDEESSEETETATTRETSVAQEESTQPESSKAEESSVKEESGKAEESSKEESSKEESSKEESSKAEESEESSEPEEEESSRENVPAPSGSYSGEFSSDTETALNVVVKWAATQNADTFYSVTVQFYLECYSLAVGPRDATVTVTTSKEERTFEISTEDIDNEDNETMQEFYLGKLSFTAPESEIEKGIELKIEWPFWGTYSEKELDYIVATGIIQAD